LKNSRTICTLYQRRPEDVMVRQKRTNVTKARAIGDIHLGILTVSHILTSAVTPVVCGVRPAFLVDNVSLEDDELEILVKSLQEVILDLLVCC
jgi:hypothetical protein